MGLGDWALTKHSRWGNNTAQPPASLPRSTPPPPRPLRRFESSGGRFPIPIEEEEEIALAAPIGSRHGCGHPRPSEAEELLAAAIGRP